MKFLPGWEPLPWYIVYTKIHFTFPSRILSTKNRVGTTLNICFCWNYFPHHSSPAKVFIVTVLILAAAVVVLLYRSCLVIFQELGYSYVELNASDTRSKRSLQEDVALAVENTSIACLLGSKVRLTVVFVQCFPLYCAFALLSVTLFSFAQVVVSSRTNSRMMRMFYALLAICMTYVSCRHEDWTLSNWKLRFYFDELCCKFQSKYIWFAKTLTFLPSAMWILDFVKLYALLQTLTLRNDTFCKLLDICDRIHRQVPCKRDIAVCALPERTPGASMRVASVCDFQCRASVLGTDQQQKALIKTA